MARYNGIPIFSSLENSKRRFVNIKYPLIFSANDDIYAFVAQGDRYDLIALSYYEDSNLWWIINKANPNQPTDSLYPIVGSQIRIPSFSRALSILNEYKLLNNII